MTATATTLANWVGGKPVPPASGDYLDKSLARGFRGVIPFLERALATAESARVLQRLEPYLRDGACAST